jgi:adenylate cyclase
MSARILVVDDTPANIQLLAGVLKENGYQISAATNGRQALDAMAQTRPDLVLLDIVMPEMDGFETCRRIKASEEWREIPVIFLTGRSDSADIVQGFELGAVDYVAKPFNTHELLARVNTHLMMHQLRASLAEKNAALALANEKVRQTFGRYVSEEVAAAVLGSPEALELGGEEREVTMLMSDLRGFTAMAARMTPREVIDTLNRYLEAMLEVIGQFQGMIDEIIGDAILVIFGAPVAAPDHAEKAVACGLAMQRALAGLNQRMMSESMPALEMGVGIHTGRVIVGNIGSQRRTKYAAVGANVNLAGRIESFTTGGQVLISDATRQGVRVPLRIDVEFKVEPKGVPHSIQLYEVGGIGAPYDLQLPARSHDMQLLEPPVLVRFTLLEEKFLGRTMHDGMLTELSPHDAALASTVPVAPFANVWITISAGPNDLPAGEIYGKAVESASDRAGITPIRLTSISPELEAWIRSR